MLNALSSLYVFVLSYLRRDEGQDFIEYGAIALIIVVGVILLLTPIGTWVKDAWGALSAALPAVP